MQPEKRTLLFVQGLTPALFFKTERKKKRVLPNVESLASIGLQSFQIAVFGDDFYLNLSLDITLYILAIMFNELPPELCERKSIAPMYFKREPRVKRGCSLKKSVCFIEFQYNLQR